MDVLLREMQQAIAMTDVMPAWRSFQTRLAAARVALARVDAIARDITELLCMPEDEDDR